MLQSGVGSSHSESANRQKGKKGKPSTPGREWGHGHNLVRRFKLLLHLCAGPHANPFESLSSYTEDDQKTIVPSAAT